MKMICGRTVVILSIFLGLPLFIIGCEGDKAHAAPAVKCAVQVDYPNITLPRNGWFGYLGTFKCENHKPESARATFQILRNGKQWAVMRARTSPIQFTTECRKGGPVDVFVPRLTVVVKNSAGKNRRFVKTGQPYHWRCLPR